jgi:hypothetical protein
MFIKTTKYIVYSLKLEFYNYESISDTDVISKTI